MERELSRLFAYIADVAIAIRMNSDYCSKRRDIESTVRGRNVMWLSDMLHNLHLVGEAIVAGTNGHEYIESLKDIWARNKVEIERAFENSPVPQLVIGVDEGIEILDSIGQKLSAKHNLNSGLLSRAHVASVGLDDMEGQTVPDGLGVVTLYVPINDLQNKNPMAIQNDIGLPWYDGSNKGVWFDG